MANEDNGLERSISAIARAHERVDEDLLGLFYRDEFSGTEMEDFTVPGTWEVVEKVGVRHDTRMSRLEVCQDIFSVR
jgi:hypothetical protein